MVVYASPAFRGRSFSVAKLLKLCLFPLHPHINWALTETIQGEQDTTIYFKYEALHALLKESQRIDLKYSVRYYPKGQSEHFSKSIPEPLVLPKPTRGDAPFKADPKDQPWIEYPCRLAAPAPVDKIPLFEPGDQAIPLPSRY